MRRQKGKNLMLALTSLVILFSLISPLPGSPAEAAGTRAVYQGMKLYTGEAHSHTSLSDGILMPEDAFDFVKQNTGLDYFGTAEHDVTFDISSGHDYFTNYKQSYSEEYKLSRAAHDQHNSRDFVTVPGVEVTWYDQAGHLNLYNTEWFPRTYGKGATGQFGMGDAKYDLPTFYARLAEDPNAIVQFNHPDAGGKGDFFGFKHFNPKIDDNVALFEYKAASYFPTYIKALDKGWHLSPSYAGDEHQGKWGASNPALTSLWTNDFTRKDVLDAWKKRRTYASFDENFQLAFSGNGKMMGSSLPTTTKELALSIQLTDPDQDDSIEKVTIYKNNGQIVKEYTGLNSNKLVKQERVPVSNGDFVLVRIFQRDGDEIISAPIWIGPKTKGTDYSPDITLKGKLPATVSLGQRVKIPGASAKDDSGETPAVKVNVFDSKGAVKVVNQSFTVKEYGEYFVRYSATDSKGNTRAELKRILVADKSLDSKKLLTEFQPIVNVGATEDQAGITLVTDKVLKNAYVQYKPAKQTTWNGAKGLKTKVSFFESAYGDNIDSSNYRILASHEADLTQLKPGTIYEYRYGMSPKGPWGPIHSFGTARKADSTTIYLMGDLQVPDRSPQSFQFYTNMLNVLKKKHPNGKLMIQTGDLVNAAGSTELWNDAFTHIYKKLGLLSANAVGNHEVIQDEDASSFSHFFNLPENGGGTFKETNYSFDYGDTHIAVLNSLDLNDEQLKWLEKDMRNTKKKWKIVIGHFPYYGGSHSDDPGMGTDRAKITSKMQQLGISLYIGGHDHVYKRTTIRNGTKNTSQKAMNLGTTFITMGSAGPKFYDNVKYNWDHVVYDDNVQTGVALEADEESLTFSTYASSGKLIDKFTLTPPQNHLELTSAEVEDHRLNGVGLLNYPGSRKHVTIVGAKYNQAGTQLLEKQVKKVKLEQLGREQVIKFDKPLNFNDQHTIKVHVYDQNQKSEILPAMLVREGMEGAGTAQSPYLLDSLADLEKIKYYPDKHFMLTKDIDGKQSSIQAIGSGDTPFKGVFDGNGHAIKNVNIESENGAGLFSVNDGVIKNLAVLDATIKTDNSDVGILVDLNNGFIENSFTTGSITGESTVGGLVGYSYGAVRNSYSTARVKATAKQAGGLIGITGRGSLTENTYATGSVTSGSSNAGGLSGYGYESTTIQNSIALNTSVITTTSANRVVGRVLAGETATLENNFARSSMIVSKEGVTKEDPNNEKGLGKTPEQVKSKTVYDEELGWDFEQVWIWDLAAGRPLLKMNRENVGDGSSSEKPPLATDGKGSYLLSSVQDLQVVSSFPNENYVLKNDLDFKGKSFTTLALDAPFMGTFDGNGKVLRNLPDSLFHLNGGTIKNVGIVNANVTGDKGAAQTGILVNLNSGTVERSYSTGNVTGDNTVGGLVGYSNHIVRNSYSTADVTANVSQAGGLVGITNTGSLMENSYATGTVKALKSNAGGITGYGYNGTVVRNTIALNPSVTAPTSANRVVGRVYSGHKATLKNNFALAEMVVKVERITVDSPTTEKGLGKTRAEMDDMKIYKEALGWDFEQVWAWDEKRSLPVLAK
ncbi:CehA/McbA family metallohydrolase [Mesobacillus foraminis]|uniref:CehA/McbA family metallohydrolase n=1 Tax=Mesobacillus foraminis TaxID=279826 RepID=UPI00214B8211|nr:CehA/McbA family metallohydrolase [Mesobacillus foraminis]